jgi:ABC-type branched-subunit amino acid transport system substrate-binding protein
VGLPTPLADPAAPWGEANIEPYQTWVEVFNREGFEVAGRTYRFELIMADDGNSPEGGDAAARQLVHDEVANSWRDTGFGAMTPTPPLLIRLR